MRIEESSSGSGRRISSLFLAGALAGGALLLASAPVALGFGFVTKWGSQGAMPGNFNHPEAVATDRSGNVYVVDHSRRVLQKFTARGALIAQWKPGSGTVLCGCGIATDRAGHVYVIAGGKATRNYRVLKYSSHGRLIDQWASIHLRVGAVPGAIAADRGGNVYLAMGAWVGKFSSKGRPLARWNYTVPGPSGRGPIDTQTNGIAADAAGDVYVTGGAWVTKFTSEGGILDAWGGGALSQAWGVATDRAGHVFVSDAKLNRVLEFASDGTYLGQFGRPGSGNGQFRGLHSLATDPRGDLYVADTSNNRVQKFGEPSSSFKLTKLTLDRRHGSARLVANVAGVGRLDLAGAGTKAVHRIAKGAGDVVVPVAPDGSTWAKLLTRGRATIEIRVTYTPTTPGSAVPASRSRRITLEMDR